MPAQNRLAVAFLHIPHADGPIQAGGGETPAVRTEGQSLGLAPSAQLYASDLLAGRHVPDAQVPVPIHGADQDTVRTDRDRNDPRARPLNFLPARAGRDVPEPEPIIGIAPGNQPRAVGTESQAPHDARVAQDRARVSRPGIPQPYRAVPTARGDPLTIRAVSDRVDEVAMAAQHGEA